jgi:SAM-dependent methyltransferase
MEELELTSHAVANRELWNRTAGDWVAAGERAWRSEAPTWGTWGVPEQELEMLPLDMTGMDAVELGCGTGYVSAWMARRGATVTGIDVSERQLATARRLADEHGVALTLVHGSAESTPFGDASFDFAISEYGAAIWCDPDVWLSEAYRILRHGGRLVFLGNHPLAHVCAPYSGDLVGETLIRPYFDTHLLDWREVEIDPGGVEFNLPTSGWFALFRRIGFEVEDYREPRPSEFCEGVSFSVPAAWARRFPSEQVWKLRKPPRGDRARE